MSKDGWMKVKFGDVVENVRRNIKDREAAGIDRVLGLGDIETGNLHVTGWKDVDSSPSFRTHFKPGQTLFGKRRAYLRKVAYAEFEGVCTQNILVFETKDPEILLPQLIPFICMSEPFMQDAVKNSTGSLFPNAEWKAIRDYEFDLPPKNVQNLISQLLWSVDSTKELFSNTVKSIRMVQRKTFSKFLESYSNSETITFGETWRNSPEGGHTPKAVKKETGHRVLTLACLGEYGFIPNKSKPIIDTKEHRKYTLEKGDFLISRSNTSMLVGRCGIVPESDPDTSFGDLFFRIAFEKDEMNSEFAMHLLQSTHGRRFIHSIAAGTSGSMKKINRKNLAKFKIPKVPLDSQDYVSSIMKRFNILANHADTHKTELNLIISLIIDGYFGDEIELQ